MWYAVAGGQNTYVVVNTSTSSAVAFRNKREPTDVAPARASTLVNIVSTWTIILDALVVGPEQGDVIWCPHTIIVEALDFLVCREESRL